MACQTSAMIRDTWYLHIMSTDIAAASPYPSLEHAEGDMSNCVTKRLFKGDRKGVAEAQAANR